MTNETAEKTTNETAEKIGLCIEDFPTIIQIMNDVTELLKKCDLYTMSAVLCSALHTYCYDDEHMTPEQFNTMLDKDLQILKETYADEWNSEHSDDVAGV